MIRQFDSDHPLHEEKAILLPLPQVADLIQRGLAEDTLVILLWKFSRTFAAENKNKDKAARAHQYTLFPLRCQRLA